MGELNVAPGPTLKDVALFESVPVALLVVDVDGRIIATNSALRRLFGYDPGELEGQNVEVLVPPEVAAGHPELRTAYMQVPYQRTMGTGNDLEGVTKSGGRVAVEIGLNAIELDQQQHIVASVVDVTALRAEQEKTRMAVDASASAMVMMNSSNEIVLVNRQAVAVFGYQEHELVGQPIEVLVPERYRRRHGVYRGSYLADPTERAMGGDRTLHGLRADGTEFPLEIGLTPVDDHGQLMVLATVIDITERVQAEEEIKRQNTDLRRLNEELGQFAYSASHDLKAPLTTLDGMLLCLQDDLDDGNLPSAHANSARARDLAKRLAHLIEGLLGFARSEHLEAKIDEVNLHDLVETVALDLRAPFSSHGVEFRNEVPQELFLCTDHRRLSQALENVLCNGAQFSNRNRDDRFVAIGARRDGNDLVITIEDNGVGIPTEVHDQVFVMFRRFGNHDQEGSGLGLALVKQHIDHLGGRITFDSDETGTTFTIRHPIGDRNHLHFSQQRAALK